MKVSKNNSCESQSAARRIFGRLQTLLLVASLALIPAALAFNHKAKPANAEPASSSGNVVRCDAVHVVAQKTPEKNDKPADNKTEKDKSDKAAADKSAAPKPEPVIENVISVTPEALVAKPHEYLGKNVKFTANFSGFNNLALDYKPAYRSSKTHLSFIVHRDKSPVPLSELKLAMMIPKEKEPETQLLATLKDGEPIELVGKVFSTALDDPWVDVLKIRKLNADKEEKKADASSDGKKTEKSSADVKTEKSAPSKTDTDSKDKGKTPSKN